MKYTNGLKEPKGIAPSQKSDKLPKNLCVSLEKDRHVLKRIADVVVGTKNW